ncbi:aminomethyl-transferring glycine dehydrogenase subunit GcvPB [Hespellia stercorisuis]|uniref:Probable glycine dehydrogenase (decarboxylating) subunit 2 n=1 Tax=Hespellia stercorisuis DSM 15480 TaxID=1121950 RepID=A0A1M6MM87_9FIRM|nr:aminomethyl-transferring glycine dehydrogenase subunit GcvPB [Hespellia stercorisuis]SHJ84577.1 glycine dehydrogenase subunit 2 [Hespellia stercorisuis DSM 15480]
MDLIFEKSRIGRGCTVLPECDVPIAEIPKSEARACAPRLPQMAEIDISRHYTELMKRTHGVNDGFYPLGSCTMKYNPKLNEELAALPGFTGVHPLQEESTVQGCLAVLEKTEELLGEITGMDQMTFQPAAGAHGEFTGLLLIKAFHKARGDVKRTKIIVPDTAHGTNPASCTMAGFKVISVPSNEEGCVDLEKLREVVGDDTAGLMLTNPNTVGIFDRNILEITKIIHEAGGLNYYDGANLNAVMGIARPGDMGFDVIHLNLHKTFSTPHGGGGPGSGAVGCKEFLAPFLPKFHVVKIGDEYAFENPAQSIGSVKAFYGNFLVVVRALSYILVLGNQGIPEAAGNAVLNANYMRVKLQDTFDIAFNNICMHEFVMSMTKLKKEKGVSALDFAKGLLDHGVHPPTMYFPLIVDEALMVEPTETESKDTLDNVVAIFKEIYKNARENPEAMHEAPHTTPVRRLDEVGAARNPVLKFEKWK